MKNAVVTAVAAIAAAALAGWGGYVFCTQVVLFGSAQLYVLLPVYIISVLAGAVLDELLHEGAHFLVGAMFRMGVKPPQFRLFKSSSVEINPKGAKGLKARFVLTAGAGLFIDLLIAALGIVAFTVPAVHPFFGIGLPYAVYTLIINGAPLEYQSGKTDGLAVCEALSNAPSAKVMFAILRVQGLVNGGTPLGEVEEDLLLNVPQLPEDDTNFIILTQLRYEYYNARGNQTEAEKYLARFNEVKQYLE